MRRLLLTACALLLVSCADSSPDLSLSLRFPTSLRAPEDRFQRFLARVDYVELVSSGAAGTIRSVVPLRTDSIPLRSPLASSGKVRLEVRVWDRKTDGVRRPFPALEGDVSFESGKGVGRELVVPLRLVVSAREYDVKIASRSPGAADRAR